MYAILYVFELTRHTSVLTMQNERIVPRSSEFQTIQETPSGVTGIQPGRFEFPEEVLAGKQ